MKKVDSILFMMMYIVLITIGILQFFEFPKVMDYLLGAVSIVLGIGACVIRLKKRK